MVPKYIIGIDEVGRGSLAGPVTVAAACIPAKLRLPKSMGKFADSKKLSPGQRARWCDYLKSHPDISFEVARVYPRRIERINISQAANSAALSACRRLIKKHKLADGDYRIILDGGLYLGKSRNNPVAKTVIKGDERFTAVKAASILAKVSRDRGMVKLAKKYPNYGFEANKGYGTSVHLGALTKYGPCDVHRTTFIGARF